MTSKNFASCRLRILSATRTFVLWGTGSGGSAALAIRTRTGSDGHPLFHGSLGLADSEFLGEGGFGYAHKGTWLLDARKSYLGYLERLLAGTRFSQDGFYDAGLKLTYSVTPTQTLSLLATGGQISINDPSPPPIDNPNILKTGSNDLAIARLGWRWIPTANILVESHAAFVRTAFEQDKAAAQLINRSLDREWSSGTNVSWNWRRGMILQAGYSLRRPTQDSEDNFFSSSGQPPMSFSSHSSDVRQDAYLQHSSHLWKNRFRLEGGLRWARLDSLRAQPVTGQLSVSYQAARATQLEAAWGRYAQLPPSGVISELPATSAQYVLAVEQRLGERSRFRAEAFDRQNEQREDIFLLSPTPIKRSALFGRDYSRGLQFMLQRRSENRFSVWLGYTLVVARSRTYEIPLPPPLGSFGQDTPYSATLADQRHTVNLFASYRFKPTVRFSVKGLFGSGFPVNTFPPPIVRIGPYERLDLRADKSWLFRKWKLSFYGELLNVTYHDNRRFAGLGINSTTKQFALFTYDGVPATPTVGLVFDF